MYSDIYMCHTHIVLVRSGTMLLTTVLVHSSRPTPVHSDLDNGATIPRSTVPTMPTRVPSYRIRR